MNVVIPTFKRAQQLVGMDYFTSAQYVLPESQRDEYAKVLPAERMIVIPDASDGSIARKRNWILANIERPLLMIDDDVESIGFFEGRSGTKDGDHCRKTLSPALFIRWAESSFELCEQLGTVLWGIAQNEDNRIYKEFQPLSLSQPVLGPFQGHLAHDYRFDERMGTKEDYDMALQVLRGHHMIMRWNKFHYICGHGDNRGGIVSMRTRQREEADCRAIERKWGQAVISYPLHPRKMSDLLNARVRVPIAGV